MDDGYISLIARYLSGDILEGEREALFELVNSSEENKAYFEEMQNLWDISGEENDETLVDVDAAWGKIAQRIEPSVKPLVEQKRAKVFRLGQLLKVAAVFVGILAAFWLINNSGDTTPQFAEYVTEGNERKEIVLPDDSRIWLNENSTLKYNKDFEPRIVELEGEAFFDVKHLDNNHKFEIKSGDTKTTVLGTSFNVRAYPNETQVEVTVETGKVLFEDDKAKKVDEKVLLTAGQSGVYKKKEATVSKETEIISNANAWKTKQLVFNDTKFSEIFEVIERYFNVNIESTNPEFLECTYRGSFDDETLDNIIAFFAFSFDLEVNRNENTIILSGESCE